MLSLSSVPIVLDVLSGLNVLSVPNAPSLMFISVLSFIRALAAPSVLINNDASVICDIVAPLATMLIVTVSIATMPMHVSATILSTDLMFVVTVVSILGVPGASSLIAFDVLVVIVLSVIVAPSVLSVLSVLSDVALIVPIALIVLLLNALVGMT